ncbi:putative metalloprotease TIKI1 [Apostichopus japonicus]|uniref:Metalloprotease TIKI homolog n=1 Tax=Stichopus japonicus TaxID=307972 RepID=A0A2G8JN15_STIJA|nr:putative metalloprotease TIKI1 [Apostichopus japonicus]
MRGLRIDTFTFIIATVVQVYSSSVRREGRLSVTELRERNHCFAGNSSKMTNSYLWRIIRDPPVYFFGTIHVPYPRVWDYIPQNIKQAFCESQNAFFELDLTDSNTSRNLKRCQMLPRGENLSTVLPENMYQRLKSHLGYVQKMMPSWGVYDEELFHTIAGNWERKRPIWVMLMVNTLNEADIRSRGIPVLDLHLTNEALKMDKRVGAVEVVQEQCVPLNGLNVSQVLFLLNRTLWQQEALRDGTIESSFSTDDLIWHYNCGDLNSMILNLDTAQIPNILNSTMSETDLRLAEEIDRYFVDELINKRNQQMASRVKEIVESKSNQSFFFALGAGEL